ncbi:hypothetical protein LLS1_31600 [Leifsonia sp. LS1]|uniref:DUF4190 domain-containing protein n=1 Tax=unclassified Leifsonia TaxID=2663824 RepID=UPI001CBBE8A1|nr:MULTISPECIES: DUF4190 domain-containing protein [unclassified Leifsonia]UAJ80021.1 DUF4190 domain-containing protein [Leifsonia sp. ZF2019]GIT81491.1 hypothetical protein LLS1_31600 [Leifsonia sp. LS1]
MSAPYQPVQPATAPGSERWNVLAIVGFVGSFFVSLLGIILGFIALSQIRRTGERGRGLAIAGIVIGFVAVVVTVLWLILVLVLFANAAANGQIQVNNG